MIRISASDAQDVPDIVLFGRENIVVFFIVPPGHLAGCFTGRVNAVLQQLASGRRIDRISNLLSTGGRGRDLEPIGDAAFGDHVLQDELGHGGAADIAVANE